MKSHYKYAFIVFALVVAASLFWHQRAYRRASAAYDVSGSGKGSSTSRDEAKIATSDSGRVGQPPEKMPKIVLDQIADRLRTRSDRLLLEWEQVSATQLPLEHPSQMMLLFLPAPNAATGKQFSEDIASACLSSGVDARPSKETINTIQNQLGWEKYPKMLLVVSDDDGMNSISVSENTDESCEIINPSTHVVSVKTTTYFQELSPQGEIHYAQLFQFEKSSGGQSRIARP